MELEEDFEHILKHTKTVCEEICGKTIFCTGATGFLGRCLLSAFLYANDCLHLNLKILILSRGPDKFLIQYPEYKHQCVSFIKGDVRDFEFPEEPIDYIIHAATQTNVALNIEQPLLMYDTIVEGTRRVLELARIKDVIAMLHTSTGAIYGKQPSALTHIPEDYNGCPDIYGKGASYGEGKRVAEMLGNVYYNDYGVNSKIARCFAFVGPYLPLDGRFAIGNFIKDVIEGNKIIINGDGSPYRSYMYTADLVIWLWHILISGKPCRPYNVGSDEDVTIKELAEIISSLSGEKPEVVISLPPNNLPPGRYVPDVSRAKEELGLGVYIGLKEGIKKTIEYHSGIVL